jgi:hypothetical protein
VSSIQGGAAPSTSVTFEIIASSNVMLPASLDLENTNAVSISIRTNGSVSKGLAFDKSASKSRSTLIQQTYNAAITVSSAAWRLIKKTFS